MSARDLSPETRASFDGRDRESLMREIMSLRWAKTRMSLEIRDARLHLCRLFLDGEFYHTAIELPPEGLCGSDGKKFEAWLEGWLERTKKMPWSNS
jgi:hypothetical protein